MNTCPNCGYRPARSADRVLCEDCFKSCPAPDVQRIEDLFKEVLAAGVRPHTAPEVRSKGGGS